MDLHHLSTEDPFETEVEPIQSYQSVSVSCCKGVSDDYQNVDNSADFGLLVLLILICFLRLFWDENKVRF